MVRQRESGSVASRERKRLLVAAATTAVVLALVILGVAALSEPRRGSGDSTSEAADPIEVMYEDAMDKLAAGDTTGAAALLRDIVTLDPANEAAQRQLDSLTNSQGGTSGDGNSGDGENPPEGGDPGEEALPPAGGGVSLDDLLPSEIDGFTVAGFPVVAEGVAELSFDPTIRGPFDMRVERVLVLVWEKGSPEDAEAYIEGASKRLFPMDPDTLTVDDVEAYFGTDGGRGATVAFVRGGYVFEAILTSGYERASEIKDVAQVVAESFPIPADLK